MNDSAGSHSMWAYQRRIGAFSYFLVKAFFFFQVIKYDKNSTARGEHWPRIICCLNPKRKKYFRNLNQTFTDWRTVLHFNIYEFLIQIAFSLHGAPVVLWCYCNHPFIPRSLCITVHISFTTLQFNCRLSREIRALHQLLWFLQSIAKDGIKPTRNNFEKILGHSNERGITELQNKYLCCSSVGFFFQTTVTLWFCGWNCQNTTSQD